jgi:SAM-dependent methyltransferase
MTIDEQLDLQFPGCLAEDFGRELPGALAAVEAIIDSIDGVDLEPLARRSPGLRGNDTPNYLRCSVARMVHAQSALARRGRTRGRVLDYGSYFGNFALAFRRAGFDVDAVDSYCAYDGVFDRPCAVLADAGVRIFDFKDTGHSLEALPDATYDVVLCMGVIEHIPATPRFLLEALDRVIVPGGHLILDTPNLVHLYNRQKFARGETVATDISAQFYTQMPFEGHHREYTIGELVWMLEQIAHRDISVEAFNYSVYGLQTLTGRDVANYWAMVADPTMREYLMTVSIKPEPGRHEALRRPPADLIDDPEHVWRRRMPAEWANRTLRVDVESELMIVHLTEQVAVREQMLVESHQRLQELGARDEQTQQALQSEVDKRDRLLAEVESRLQREIQWRDEMLTQLRRTLDRLTGRALWQRIRRLYRDT